MKQNYKRGFLKILFTLALLAITTITYTNQNGPSAGLTGAPSEGNCTSCHSGTPVTSGSNFDNISISGLPVGGYAPGVNYTLTFNGGSAALSKNGFQITALSPTNAAAGTFTASTGSQAFIGSGRNYIGHTSSGTSQSQWTFSWTAPSVGVGTITFYAALNATNGSNSVAGDIVYLKTFTTSAGNLPVASITSPAPSSIFCAGDSVQFTGSATNNPTSFAWDFLGNNPNSSNLQNPKIRFNNPGFFTVRFRATNSSGTSTNAQITIQVVAKPIASISPAGSIAICGGDSATLSAPAGNGLTYLWSPGNQTSKDIKIANAGTYSVKVTNASGCFNISPNTIATLNSKPAGPGITCVDSICTKDSISVSTSSGFSSYKYFVNGNLVLNTTTSTVKLTLNPGTFQIGVSGFNGTCNSEISSKQVVVSNQMAAPTLTCATSTSNSVSFNLTGGLTQISLDSGNNWINPNGINSHTINGLSPNQTIYAMARTIDGPPCLYSLIATKTCVASNCQPISYSILKPSHVCLAGPGGIEQKSVVIKMANISGQDAFVKFGNQAYSRIDSFNLSMVSGNNNLLIKVIDSANASCGSKDSTITILGVAPIDPLPQIDQNVVPACSNGNLTIQLSFPGNTSKIAQYFKEGDSIPFESRTRTQGFNLTNLPVTLHGFENGTLIKVRVIDSIYNCPTYSLNEMLAIVFPAPAKMQVFKENLKVELRDTGASTSRSWDFGDGNTAQNTSRIQNHTYASAGTYNITLRTIDQNACVDSVTKSIQIAATGLNQMDNVMGLALYPNPAVGFIQIGYSSNEWGNVSVLDIHGKLVLETRIKSGEKLNLESLNAGVYSIQIQVANQSAIRKIILNK